MILRGPCSFFLLLLLVTPGPSTAQSVHAIELGTGFFNATKNERALAFHVSYRARRTSSFFVPITGVNIHVNGDAFSYGGLSAIIFHDRILEIAFDAAVGTYFSGPANILGLPLEFRTGFQVNFLLPQGNGLGVAIHHISNAGLSEINPGTETIVLKYFIPLNSSSSTP